MVHVGVSEWDCKGSLGWSVQTLLQLRTWLVCSRQSRYDQGGSMTVILLGLDFMD